MYSVPGKVKLCIFLRFTKKGPKTARHFGKSLASQTGRKRVVSTNDGKHFVCHSAIPPFRLPFRHSATPPLRHSAIPPFRHFAIPPFRYSAIPPFHHSAGKNRLNHGKNPCFAVRIRILCLCITDTIGCLRRLIVVSRSFVRYLN